MTPTTETWFRRRNLHISGPTDSSSGYRAPSEVMVYMLVLLGKHPEKVPSRIKIFLAESLLAGCVSPDPV